MAKRPPTRTAMCQCRAGKRLLAVYAGEGAAPAAGADVQRRPCKLRCEACGQIALEDVDLPRGIAELLEAVGAGIDVRLAGEEEEAEPMEEDAPDPPEYDPPTHPTRTHTAMYKRLSQLGNFLLLAGIAGGLLALWLGILLFAHAILTP